MGIGGVMRILESNDDKPIAAIGDIHGAADLFVPLLDTIEDAGSRDGGWRIIMLGDYVDRGDHSRAVIDRLLEGPRQSGNEFVFLRGNHDAMMLDSIDDKHGKTFHNWLKVGGLATLFSYGLDDEDDLYDGSWVNLLPSEHIGFLSNLDDMYLTKSHVFVHAGVRPGVELTRQEEIDTLWIRDLFLDCSDDFGKIVVHGHTISQTPELRPNRIGIDTGGYLSGRLSAVLIDSEVKFLQASKQGNSVPLVEDLVLRSACCPDNIRYEV